MSRTARKNTNYKEWELVEGELKVFKQFRHTLWVVHQELGGNYWTVTEYFSGIKWIYVGAKDKNSACRELKRQIIEHGEKKLLALLKEKFKQKNVPTKKVLKKAFKLGYKQPETKLWVHSL